MPVATLYRTVSTSEYADLRATGRLRPSGGADGKYFWETHGDAERFGQRTAAHYHPGGYRVVAVDVETSSLVGWHRWAMLDGIGPARFAPAEVLDACVVRFEPDP